MQVPCRRHFWFNSTVGLTLGHRHGISKLQKEHSKGHSPGKICSTSKCCLPEGKMLNTHSQLRSKHEKADCLFSRTCVYSSSLCCRQRKGDRSRQGCRRRSQRDPQHPR